MDLAAIRQGIKDALGDNGVRVYAYVPDNPITPCWIVRPQPYDYPASFEAGLVEVKVSVLMLAGTVNVQGAQDLLDGWLSTTGDSSLYAAIDKDTTLGGAASSCVVERLEHYDSIEIADGGTRYLSAELLLDVFA
jgi:hypothetical protein